MGEFRLKSINKDTLKSALKKAGWYRTLNEPLEAESICRDVSGPPETTMPRCAGIPVLA